MGKNSNFIALLIFASLSLSSCGGESTEALFSDRHAHSYKPFSSAFSEIGPGTLILLDYHSDAGPGPDQDSDSEFSGSLTSFNWVGGLIERRLVTDVYWVSGRDLLKPNRESRGNWFERVISGDSPNVADLKRSAFHIVDWPELLEIAGKKGFSGPLGITLDLDVLTVDPGDDPDRFLAEMTDFIIKAEPDVLTVALSASYQKNPVDAWHWFAIAYSRLCGEFAPSLALGSPDPPPEGREEAVRWRRWAEAPFSPDFGAYLAPGSALWDNAPARIWQILEEKMPAWNDGEAMKTVRLLAEAIQTREDFSKNISESTIDHTLASASLAVVDAVKTGGEGEEDDPPISGENHMGIGVRLVKGWEDRGCLTFYSGVEDFSEASVPAARGAALTDPRYRPVAEDELSELDIEVSFFGEFRPMDGPLDFIPGIDTLILETDENRTLLQASLAAERGLSRLQFLEVITRKAGLAPGSWKNGDVRFFKAPTVSRREPLLREK